jgi:hypothetical protein
VHLTRTDTNERAEVKELRGVAADDLRGALQEMEAIASGTRCTKPFYHASIDPRAGERLTEEQRTKAIDRLEKELGLVGQPRVVVVHEKEGREHCHIVWSRVDIDTMRTISDSHNYRKHELVARELERDFGHERVQGVHVERDGKPRPERTPSHAEMLQSQRTGLNPQEIKDRVTDIWKRTDNGSAFAVALWEDGFTICRGDRRDFVLVDHMGGTHSLARCIDGAKTKDVRARMADLDPAHLPSVAEGKAIQHQRRELFIGRAEPTPRNPPPSPDAEPELSPRTDVEHQLTAKAVHAASNIASVLFSAVLGETPAPKPPPTKLERQHMDSVRDDQHTKDQFRQEALRNLGHDLGIDGIDNLDPGREPSRR